jgi:hypothetical protein
MNNFVRLVAMALRLMAINVLTVVGVVTDWISDMAIALYDCSEVIVCKLLTCPDIKDFYDWRCVDDFSSKRAYDAATIFYWGSLIAMAVTVAAVIISAVYHAWIIVAIVSLVVSFGCGLALANVVINEIKNKQTGGATEDETEWNKDEFGFGNPDSVGVGGGLRVCARCENPVEVCDMICIACANNLLCGDGEKFLSPQQFAEAHRDVIAGQVRIVESEVADRQRVAAESEGVESVDMIEPSVYDQDESARFSSPLVESVSQQDAEYLLQMREALDRAAARDARKTEKPEGENKS